MGKSRVQTRVEPDTKHQIDEYAEDRDIGDAEALRRLIRAGLAAEGHPVTAADGGTKPLLERLAAPRTVGIGALIGLLGVGFMSLAGLFVNSGDLMVALGLFTAGTALTVVTAAVVVTATLAQLALARPLRGLLGLNTDGETA